MASQIPLLALGQSLFPFRQVVVFEKTNHDDNTDLTKLHTNTPLMSNDCLTPREQFFSYKSCTS